jgi:flagellar biosynthesis protein FlhF
MIIKKFQGKTKEDALESARKELGDGLVEMNVKTVKNSGVRGWFKKNLVEVTVAKEDENETKSVAVKQEVKPEVKPEIKPEFKPEFKIELPRSETPKVLEEKLDNLQSLIENQISNQMSMARQETESVQKEQDSEEEKARINFLKLLYTKMTDNEIDEKYAHDIIEEIDKNCKPDVTMDFMLSEVYQRMILKLGRPYTMNNSEGNAPNVVFFVGPTGVGKTTTIAKIASQYTIEKKKKVALLTADTYRIAAAEQLKTYANILEIPFKVVYTAEEISSTIDDFKDYDYILVDTTGHSPNDETQCENMAELIKSVETEGRKEVFLVLSASTKYRDLINIADTYKGIADYKLIFTKLDETSTLGNIYNIKLYTGASLSYTTSGQNVPDDIDYFDPQSTVKQLLGGRR